MTLLRSLYIAIVLSFIGIAQAQQPSGTPQCTTSCPAQDKAGFAVADNSDSGGVLFCSYPAFEGENKDDFYCTYNSASSSGGLITDNDAGFCPENAVMSCAHSRRFKGDDNYTAMLRKKSEAAAVQPQSSERRVYDPRKVKARKPFVSL
ncbi:hypothetical protein C8R45DRAFT_441646 [Mycena sanguinolenta]|nr:hypothetical protein C8R45DRAFT_441646 [Mycena sanguinolenta]